MRLITMLVTSMLEIFDYVVSTANFSWHSALRERSICAGGSGRNGLAQVIRILVCTYVIIKVNDQIDALFLNVFISCFYMFRATSAHHQEDQLVSIHHLV